LLDSHERHGNLTDRQWPWVDKLIERATPRQQQPREHVGDLGPLLALFDRARKHLKHPAIVLRVDGIFSDIRLSVASERAKVPGSINVATNEAFGEGLWYGRITRDGAFEPSRQETPDALLPALRAFACDPVGKAAEHGRLTGRCCFCNRGLDDARSTAVGYGPTCAKNFGLPWGTKKGETR
jgi:hypothetical protein